MNEGRELADAELALPFEVADYVDFYSSLDHATNLGRMFRPDAEPLLPNWRHLPVGYHGAPGTVVPSGTPVRRPSGQRPGPEFGPSARLDIELEAGFVIGIPEHDGRAGAHRAGARPRVRHGAGQRLVGPRHPGLGVPAARTVPRQVVRHLDVPLGRAARPSSRDRRVAREAQEPQPLPYLREEPWAYDIPLEVELNGTVVARSNTRHLYWSIAQQIAHLTVNGASLRTGDLLATGTISGPEPEARGSLIELSWNGQEPIELADGSTRTFLEDGDEVILRGEPLGEVQRPDRAGARLSACQPAARLRCQRSWPLPTFSPWRSLRGRPATTRRCGRTRRSRRSRTLPSRCAARASST